MLSEKRKQCGAGGTIADNSLTDADLSTGSFAKITGVGTLGALTVTGVGSFGGLSATGGANLATTSGNVGIGNTNPGKKLDVTYRMAWIRGLKTTYYLRALSATSTEKSTVDRGTLNAVSSGAGGVSAKSSAPSTVDALSDPAEVPLACSIDNPDCEACQ